MRPADQKHKRKSGEEMLQRNAIRRQTCGSPNHRHTPWLYAESIAKHCDAFWISRGINPKAIF